MSETPDRVFSIGVSSRPDDVIVVSLVGELDVMSAPEFEARVREIHCDATVRVLVDVSGLVFVDSSGLNSLVKAAVAAEARGAALVLAGASPHIARVFEVVRMSDSVWVEPSVEIALERLATGSSRTS